MTNSFKSRYFTPKKLLRIMESCPDINQILSQNAINNCVNGNVCKKIANKRGQNQYDIRKYAKHLGYIVIGYRQHQILDLKVRGYTIFEAANILGMEISNCKRMAEKIEDLL